MYHPVMILGNGMDIDLDALFADADQVIERSRQLTEKVKATRSEAEKGTDLFKRWPEIRSPEPLDPATAPPKRRWHAAIFKGH
jgi:hypothetical protein